MNDVLEAMKATPGIEPKIQVVSATFFRCRHSSDIINAPVNRPQCVETTAMGAAYLAGLAVDTGQVKRMLLRTGQLIRHSSQRLQMKKEKKRIKGWNKAVKYAFMDGQKKIRF